MDRTRNGTRSSFLARGVARAGAACLALGACLWAWPQADAASSRYATSFESPEFAVGGLDGQSPDWAATAGASVSSSEAQGGSQSVQLAVGAESGFEVAVFSLPTPFDGAAGESTAVRIRGVFRTSLAMGPQISLAGLFDAEGSFFGQFTASSGTYRLGSGTGSAPSPVQVTGDSWTPWELEVDFATQTFTARVDGTLAATGGFEAPATSLGSVSFFAYSGSGDYDAYLDDFSVTPIARPLLATGFESPEFTEGDIDGQSGWGGDVARVQSDIASTGSSSVSLTRNQTPDFAGVSHALPFDPSTAPSPIVRFRVDFHTDLQETPLVSVFSFGGPEGLIGQFNANGGGYALGTGIGTAPGQIPVEANRWTRLDIELDFHLQRITARVDGRLAATGDFENPSSALSDFTFGAYGGADYSVLMDNLSVVVAPPPVLLTGFETEDQFVEDALDGQNGWTGSDGAEIQTEVVAHGEQAFRLRPAGEGPDERAYPLVSFDPSRYGSGALRFSADFWTDESSTPQIASPAFYGPADEYLCQLETLGGSFLLGEGQGRAPSYPAASASQWHRLEVDLDFSAGSVVARADDALAGTADFANSAAGLGSLDFYAFGGGNSYQAVFDDVSLIPLEHPEGPSVAAPMPEDWTVGLPFEASPSAQMSATKGTAPIRWSVVGGSLPPTMLLTEDGLLQGGPGAAGDYSFDVQAEDAYGFRDRRTASLHVNAYPEVTTQRLPPAALGRDYSAHLTVQGGTPPYVWFDGNPGLPDGLSVSLSGGAVSGRPETAGSERRDLQVQDRTGAVALADVELDVADALDLSRRSARISETATAESPRRSVRFLELTGDTVVDAIVSGRFPSTSPVEVRLLYGDGSPVDLGGYLFVSRVGARVKRFPVPATGRYFLETTLPEGFAGRVTTRVVITPPRKFKGTVTIGSGEEVVPFTAPPGTRIASIVVTRPRGSEAKPGISFLTGDDMVDLVPTGRLSGGSRLRFRSSETLDAIHYRLGIVSGDGTPGDLNYLIVLRTPRRFEFSLPDLPAGEVK